MLLIKNFKLIPPFKQMKIRLFTSSIVGFTDNHAAHHVVGVEEIIEATGALLLYLPPYCPELNPIGGIFSIVKGWFRGNDLMFLITLDSKEMVFRGFFHVTRSDVQSLYTHCGYS